MIRGASVPTRFTKRYGVRQPLTQAGMAFAGWSPELATAVGKAGGIGAIGAAMLPPEAVSMLVKTMKGARCGPFHVNFISCFEHEAQVRVCAEEGAPIVSFHWGLPHPHVIRMLKDNGCDVWQQVGSVEQARRALGEGVDTILAQGHEAGGHNLQGVGGAAGMGVFTLVPTLRDALGEKPLILATGGIADGRGVAAALHLGADGVVVGTRLVATREANVHDEYKRRLLAASGEDTALTAIFGADDPTFNPMRVIRNGVVRDWNDRLDEVGPWVARGDVPVVGSTEIGGEIVPLTKFDRLVPIPTTRADWEEVPFLAGQGVGLVHDLPGAGEVVERMMDEAKAALSRGVKVRV